MLTKRWTNPLPDAGDVVIVDFPGVTGVKRRPAVILSSVRYHATRPDVIVGVVTSNLAAANGPTDYVLQDWAEAGLRVPSAFRAFFLTMPLRSANLAHIGKLAECDWEAVRARVRLALAVFEADPLP